MGLILIPCEVKNLIQLMKHSIHSKMEQYMDADEALRDYINDEELDCEAWRASKDTMHVCYQSIIGGMRVVQDNIVNDLDVLESSIGNENLDEDELESRIKMLEAECQQYENSIAAWNTIKNNFPNAGFSMGIGSLTDKYEGIIQSTKAAIEELKKKIDFLHDVEEKTTSLFEEGISLLQLVSAAISDGGVTVNGEGEYLDVNWLQLITLHDNEKNQKISVNESYISNLKNSNIEVEEIKKMSMCRVAEMMFDLNYEPEFVAGILGNIMAEGTVGIFESSSYTTNPDRKPQYLEYMEVYCNYKIFSAKSITEIGIEETRWLYEKACMSEGQGKFGLGCIQWTDYQRLDGLLKCYESICDGNYPTIEECIKAESKWIVQEFEGEYHSIYEQWRVDSANMGEKEKAEQAGILVCQKYEKPKADTSEQRGKSAENIYCILVGEKNDDSK